MSEFISSKPLETAVLFLIFNRLETTKKVFNEIRKAKPPRLYLASDGARADRPGEYEVVESVRKYVLDNIDWDCEVKTLLRDKNLGCKYAVSGAITWFFENEEQGIITNNSYVWGWATWRSRWKHFSLDLDTFDEYINNLPVINSEFYSQYIKYIYKLSQSVNTWDYQWFLTILKNRGLSITSSLSLIKNIGLDCGTHVTVNQDPRKDINYNIESNQINFPITHPKLVNCKKQVEDELFRITFLNSLNLRGKFKNTYVGSLIYLKYLHLKKIFKLK